MPEFLSVNAARDHYAEPVLSDVRMLAERVPAHVAALLRFLASHLFNQDVFATVKMRFARARPCPLKDVFTRAVRMPLGRYLRERRLEVAAALVEHTEYSCNEIAIAVGFERSAFYKAFAEWPPSGGLGPVEWRAERRAEEGEEKAAPPTETAASRLAGWRRALILPWTLGEGAEADPVGALLRHPGVRMMVHLLSHYPTVADRCRRRLGRKPTGEVMNGDDPDGDDPYRMVKCLAFESFKAKRFEEALARAPSPFHAACLRVASPMKSFVHFHVLSRTGDAEAARASLEPCHSSVADLLPTYRAKAALGVAREALAAGDLHAAEMELGVAEVQNAAAGLAADPVTQPGILAARAELLYQQGRWPEAAETAGRAAGAYRRLGRTGRAAKAVVLREAALGRGTGGESVEELERALAAVDESTQGEVAAQLLSALAVAYARQGEPEKTEAVLERLAALCRHGDENDR